MLGKRMGLGTRNEERGRGSARVLRARVKGARADGLFASDASPSAFARVDARLATGCVLQCAANRVRANGINAEKGPVRWREGGGSGDGCRDCQRYGAGWLLSGLYIRQRPVRGAIQRHGTWRI